MPYPMHAVILPEYDQPLEVDVVEIDPPGPREVLVEMRASGVCRSDWHAIRGHLPLPVPLVLGHEGAGIVREVGPEVDRVHPGDRVVLSWIPSCGVCQYCVNGQPELCDRANNAAVEGTLPSGQTRVRWRNEPISVFSATGTLADLAVVSVDSVVPIPASMPFDQAALLGCAVQTGVGAALRSPIKPGDSVAVIGAGGVGLNIVQGAKIRGAAEILVVDPSKANRQLARDFGATQTIDPDSDNPLLAILDLTHDRGVDVGFEAVGDVELLALAFNAVRKGGTAVAVGVPAPNDAVSLNAFAFVSQEKTLTGSWYGSSFPLRDIPRLCALWSTGQLRLEPLIQRRYTLADTARAFEDLAKARGGRSVIVWS
ncbi:MAG: alcohol dehydrogenase [Sulfobacillus acidophilus]|uniref:Alcohol dehydrogenase n=1 Tax=Sulfobacillus acidophilus TaxID=53633 RepID=A0A2T2WGX7_9FIRM|nr:MAG: alcohol dehydrogenase [Sulfobacillus acidophilus]